MPAGGAAEAPVDAADAWLVSCALLTTVPNGMIAPVHHRMPVVLAPDAIDAWLDPQFPLADAHALCRPCAYDVMRVEPAAPAATAA